MCSHWGEIPDAPVGERLIAPAREKLLREISSAAAASVTSAAPVETDLPPIHQPSARHFPPGIPDPSSAVAAYRCDALTAHTIRLQQHARAVQQLIDGRRLKQERSVDSRHGKDHAGAADAQQANLPEAPAVPPCDGCPTIGSHNRKAGRLPFVFEMDEQPSPFDRGLGVAPPPLDQAAAKRLLKRAVAFVLAHTGFESASQNSLEVVVDVAHEFYQRLTKLIRVAVDNEATRGYTGFQDPMQEALHEVGIGGVTELHKFYWSRVVRRHVYWLDRCHRLVQQYEQLSSRTGTDDSTSAAASGVLSLTDESSRAANAVIHRSAVYPEASRGELMEESDEDDDDDDPEKLLQLAGLSGYDIKLEQRPGCSSVSSRREASDSEVHFEGPLDSDYISSGPASSSSNVELLSPLHSAGSRPQLPGPALKRKKT